MRRMLFVALMVVVHNIVWAQKQVKTVKNQPEIPVSIASTKIKKLFIPPLEDFKLKSANLNVAEFDVVYADFSAEAKSALRYAISIWENLLASEVPIKVSARFAPLSNNILAKSRPSMHYKNFPGALSEDVLFPVALAEKLSGKNLNHSESDIICTFNSTIPWYFGTDGNTPESSYDFVTAVLHELGHGLGISGFLKVDDNTGYFDNSANLPGIYDIYIHNQSNQKLADQVSFESPSESLFRELVSEKLMFYCTAKNHEHRTNIQEKLFAPSSWKKGSSIYHLDEEEINTTGKLMSPYTAKAEAIHNPGEETLTMLYEMGWKSLSFRFEEMKDFEEPCANLPVQIKIVSDFEVDSTSVKLYFLSNYSNSFDSLLLHSNKKTNLFSGNIPLEFCTGKVRYFLKAKSKRGQIFTYPTGAPVKFLSFFIGPDFFPPVIKHNPTLLVSGDFPEIPITARASDNVGIDNVMVEYRINGEEQEPFLLDYKGQNEFQGLLALDKKTSSQSKIEYRLVARDHSKRGNKKMIPANGYYNIKVFNPSVPLAGYFSDFNTENHDFICNGFEVSATNGFTGGILHTLNPYPVSQVENERYNLVAMLANPVILEENGKMIFDEVVLVEPGEPECTYQDLLFWDYVIIEGSKNGGITWVPFVNGYDSGELEVWENAFSEIIKNKTSQNTGNESMLIPRTINLTSSDNFTAGDTVLIRFRLSSDHSMNGWGWAIDNLQIQPTHTFAKTPQNRATRIYPNPFQDEIVIDFQHEHINREPIVKIFDNLGMLIYMREFPGGLGLMERINLSRLSPGIYHISITGNDKILFRATMTKQ